MSSWSWRRWPDEVGVVVRHDCATGVAGVYFDGGDDGRDMMMDGRIGWFEGDSMLV